MSRDKSLPEDVGEVGLFDEATGGTPSVDWEADDVPANPEPPAGVIVDEHDAKVIANRTFLSNVKWSSISMPWETGFMKNIFGEDVLGLTSDLRQDASWIEAVKPSHMCQCLPSLQTVRTLHRLVLSCNLLL